MTSTSSKYIGMDSEVAVRGCGGRGPYANSIVGRDGFEVCHDCAVEHDLSRR